VFIKVDPDLVPPALLQYNATTNTPNPAIPQAEWPIHTNQALDNIDFAGMTPPSCRGRRVPPC
jgi:hypothetical protein